MVKQYISKSALVAEIEKKIMQYEVAFNNPSFASYEASLIAKGKYQKLLDILQFINTIEVKEVEEYKQPEYSCFETIYKCGKKPHWNIGDMLAYYEFYSNREGECVLGKVINVELNEEQGNWFYTFEDGDQYDEASLLENETYKK